MVLISQQIQKCSGSFRWLLRISLPFRYRIILLSVISMAVSVTGVGFAMVTRGLIDAATGSPSSTGMLGSALSLGGIVLFQLIIQSFLSVLSINTVESFQNHLRRRLFARLCNSPLNSLWTLHSGDLMTRFGGDVNQIAAVSVTLIPEVFALFAQLVTAFLALFFYDRIMAAAAFLLGPIVILSARLYSRKLKPLFESYQKCDSAEKSFLQESIQNLLLVKTFHLSPSFQKKLTRLQEEKTSWVTKRNAVSVIAGAWGSLGYWLGVLAALLWGSYRLSTGMISFGTVTAFIQLVGQVQGPFLGLSRALPRFVHAAASADRLRVIDTLPEEPLLYKKPDLNARAGLSVEHISFFYSENRRVLKDVAFSVSPGEMVGIMGPTGDGKTTLLRLLLSLVRPCSGSIRIVTDDGSVLDAGPETRAYFSYVPQGNSILSGTIAENLRLGNQDATDEELISALRESCAWDFVSVLPDTIHTFIGEKGTTLSEGQSQRLAIARAFLHNAPILLLDEATSALDADTEERVIRMVRRKKKTCIFISHRSILPQVCDSVYQISNGHIGRLSVSAPFLHTLPTSKTGSY